MRERYLRFVTERVDGSSGKRQGIFQAAAELVEGRELRDYERAELEGVQWWFGVHLGVPDRFSRSRRSGAARRAICWFRSGARRLISRMHLMCWILNEHGLCTEMITTRRPGYVVFEDENQVAAVPFRETRT
jgi:hypothetical protein